MTDHQTAIERFRQSLWQLVEENQALMPPRRSDRVEQWLKTRRDSRMERDSIWWYLNEMLDDYRLHADTGTPLDQHACEGGNVDDCAGCYEASKGAKP